MKKRFLTIIIALLCTFAGSWQTAMAATITKTYLFSGGTAGSQTTFQGYFYEEGKDAHYTCFPNPWTFENTGNIHATLADGITINIASSTNQIFVQNKNNVQNIINALAVLGNVTVTVGGGTQHNYYIWHVELYNAPNQTSINEYNWGADAESTHTFSKTIGAGFIYKLVVTYSTDDIYLINESSTTISGVDDEYAYTGSRITPEPVVVCNGRTLTKGTHYYYGYSQSDKLGTATLTVIGKSPYHGSVTKNYEIIDPASVPLEWTAGSTVEVTENNTALNPISVTGTGNVTLRIANGVTLTAQYGITIADGATLTVEGPGTLTVNNNASGTEGTSGSDDANATGGTGGIGFAGVSGSLIVNGGTVNITGGTGGTGGVDVDNGGKGGNGGAGGAGISGLLTVNGGTVNITGGHGGSGGYGGRYRGKGGNGGAGGVGISGLLVVNGGTVSGKGGNGGHGGNEDAENRGKSGADGKALGSTVTCTAATHIIQESSNSSTWSNLASGSTSTLRYVRVLPLTPLTLYDNADNTTAITEAAADGKPYTVTLDGRTLYKDGDWNTIVLPFNMSAEQVTAQLAPAALMTLSTSSFANGELTLNFADATTIEAGKPYIIKWAATTPNYVENPTFTGVTLSNATSNVEATYADFCGTYSPITWNTETKSILFLGTNNTLYYPEAGAHIGAFRCYYELGNGLTAGDIANTRMNFESETTGILSTTKVQLDGPEGKVNFTNYTNKADAWYTLEGVRLNGKPSARGMYIHGGRKTVIK